MCPNFKAGNLVTQLKYFTFFHFRIVAKTTKDIFGLEMVSLHGMPTALPVLQGCGVNWVSILFSNLGPKDGLRVF